MTVREILRKLNRLGFKVDHTTGSHYILRHPDGRRVVVPYHGSHDIKLGTLKSIVTQAQTDWHTFHNL